jgi:hypothetical protein
MELSAISTQYVRILTAALANGGVPELMQPGSLAFKSSAHIQG